MIIEKNSVVQGKHTKPIVTDIFYVDTKIVKPIIIFCHGYKGFKDWGAWNLVAKAFAEAGFFFIKFNFSHNGGTLEEPIDFPDLESFGQNNYSKELDDLESILDWVTNPNFRFKDQVDTGKISVIGHSRGGGIAAIKTAEDTRITTLITWASVCDYESRFPTGETLDTWRKQGVSYVQNGRTKQQMPHYFQFYTSFVENKEQLTISSAAKKIKVPHLIIHGTEDPTVDMAEARKLHDWNPTSQLLLVDGADHVFGSKHPWGKEALPQELLEVIKKTIEFTNI